MKLIYSDVICVGFYFQWKIKLKYLLSLTLKNSHLIEFNSSLVLFHTQFTLNENVNCNSFYLLEKSEITNNSAVAARLDVVIEPYKKQINSNKNREIVRNNLE